MTQGGGRPKATRPLVGAAEGGPSPLLRWPKATSFIGAVSHIFLKPELILLNNKKKPPNPTSFLNYVFKSFLMSFKSLILIILSSFLIILFNINVSSKVLLELSKKLFSVISELFFDEIKFFISSISDLIDLSFFSLILFNFLPIL